MAYIPPETIADVKKIDLLTYLQNYEPDELVHISGNEYSTKTHSSLKISNGVWHWHSQGVGGKTALQFLIEVRGMKFMEAVSRLINAAAIMPPVFMPESRTIKREAFHLPPPNKNNHRVMSYLFFRGIDKDVIAHCIHTGRVYEDEKFHNAVFVGQDESSTARYAALRGTGNARFMGEVKGSNKRYGFSLISENANKNLHLFESAIDLLSFATIQKIMGIDFRQSNLLSLGGVGSRTQKESGNLPLALEQFLTQHPQIEKVFLHLDNDEAGRQANVRTSNNAHKLFDISQTNVKPTPVVAFDEKLVLRALLHNSPVKIVPVTEPIGGARYIPNTKEIHVQKGMDIPDLYRTVAMELALAQIDRQGEFATPQSKFRAFCVSYMLCKRYDIDTSPYSFDSAPASLQKLESKELRKELAVIKDTMSTIDKRIYRNLNPEKSLKDKKTEVR